MPIEAVSNSGLLPDAIVDSWLWHAYRVDELIEAARHILPLQHDRGSSYGRWANERGRPLSYGMRDAGRERRCWDEAS